MREARGSEGATRSAGQGAGILALLRLAARSPLLPREHRGASKRLRCWTTLSFPVAKRAASGLHGGTKHRGAKIADESKRVNQPRAALAGSSDARTPGKGDVGKNYLRAVLLTADVLAAAAPTGDDAPLPCAPGWALRFGVAAFASAIAFSSRQRLLSAS